MHIAEKNIIPAFIFTCMIAFPSASFAKEIKISGKPIQAFLPSQPEKKQFGKLHFINGLELKSKNDNFGGLSGIRLSQDGNTLYAVTDQGHFLKANIERDYDGKISALNNTEFSRLRNRKGERMKGKRQADAEALEISGSQYMVGFERNHRVDFFNLKKGKLRADERAKPLSLKAYDLPNNKGPEAIALSPLTNELFIFAEYALDEKKHHQGFIVKDDKTHRIFVTATIGYSLTDAHFLPNGDLLILERFYTPFTGQAMRIRKFKADTLKTNALLQGEVLIEASSQMEIDNMEGMAISKTPDGSTRLTLISDDNFSANQRTIILEFKLTD